MEECEPLAAVCDGGYEREGWVGGDAASLRRSDGPRGGGASSVQCGVGCQREEKARETPLHYAALKAGAYTRPLSRSV